jgi:hypothetical protein
VLRHPRNGSRQASALPTGFLYSAIVFLVFVFFDWVLLHIHGFGGDWSPLWVAGRVAWSDPSRLYDFAFVTKLQEPILGDVVVRPFIYPPSALLFFAPASLPPFWVSFALFSVCAALLLAFLGCSRITDRLPLLASPPIFLAMMTGQPTLLAAALAVAAMVRLKGNRVLAGILFATAALLKPTLFLLLPVGLIAGRHWRALLSAGIAAALLLGWAILLFGVGPWFAWIEALPRFRELFDKFAGLYRNGVTPHAFALQHGLDAGWVTVAIIPLVALAAAIAFIRTDDWRVRLVMIVGGSLMASPYAMNYELAALAPIVLTLRREKAIDLILPLIWGVSLFFNASLAGLAVVYAWALIRVFDTWRASAAGDGRVQPGVHVRA